jgi:hypothetical protein
MRRKMPRKRNLELDYYVRCTIMGETKMETGREFRLINKVIAGTGQAGVLVRRP